MPAPVNYPGVYVEEIPTGVRTITGVATSITAFLGKAVRGPIDTAVTVTSFADFERVFGGLSLDSTMSYLVKDFFANGGSQAVVVRVYKNPSSTSQSIATMKVPANFVLDASSEGAWGNQLRARVDQRPVADPNLVTVATQLGVAPGDLFDLTIHDTATKQTETFLNLTAKDSARRADRVLQAESRLARVNAASVPTNTTPDKHIGLLTDSDVWTDTAKSTPANTATDTPKNAVDSAALDAPAYIGLAAVKTGPYALEQADLFNLLCIAADTHDTFVPDDVFSEALDYCVKRRAVLLVDSKPDWTDPATALTGLQAMNLTGDRSRNAAIYFPRLKMADPLLGGRIDSLTTFAPSGMVAGVWARTDTQRGVWKAPAGTDAALNGASGLQVDLTDLDCGLLNPLGINCLRTLPVFGRVVWGARTLSGTDAAADEYKYVPVRRTALYIEESLYRALKWAVFEPNDEPLWSQIRLNVGAFMHDLFRQGAFQGQTPSDAYLIKCDKETTTQNDINLGVVNILVGFAPLKPAEFVTIQLQQRAGQIQT